jgi:two-component system chemotaxis response regulator CheB
MVCGVLLSGTLDDGVAGLQAIRKAGGCAIVQEPADALFADMPRNAINANAADITAPADELAGVIVECIESAIRVGRIASNGEPARDERETGKPSMFACPECGGVLWEASENDIWRFRCHTGHAYNVNSILSKQKDNLENSLWAALRIMQERVNLLERLAQRAHDRGDMRSSERFARQVQDLRNQEVTIRLTLTDVVEQQPPSAS